MAHLGGLPRQPSLVCVSIRSGQSSLTAHLGGLPRQPSLCLYLVRPEFPDGTPRGTTKTTESVSLSGLANRVCVSIWSGQSSLTAHLGGLPRQPSLVCVSIRPGQSSLTAHLGGLPRQPSLCLYPVWPEFPDGTPRGTTKTTESVSLSGLARVPWRHS